MSELELTICENSDGNLVTLSRGDASLKIKRTS